MSRAVASLQQRIQGENDALLNDGEWHTVLLSAEGSKVKIFVDGKYINQIKNSGSSSLTGHVLRVGQATKRFRLGASDLPNPFRGETFDGEIDRARFYNQTLTESDVAKLNEGGQLPRKSVVLDWSAKNTGKLEMKKGPIRIQSDLSKIRYANIWLQPLED